MYQDYKDLLSAFHAHGVKYLIVGGYAVIFHAQPRFTTLKIFAPHRGARTRIPINEDFRQDQRTATPRSELWNRALRRNRSSDTAGRFGVRAAFLPQPMALWMAAKS
jgi:hypothetical protein